jgi:hypothetical protein
MAANWVAATAAFLAVICCSATAVVVVPTELDAHPFISATEHGGQKVPIHTCDVATCTHPSHHRLESELSDRVHAVTSCIKTMDGARCSQHAPNMARHLHDHRPSTTSHSLCAPCSASDSHSHGLRNTTHSLALTHGLSTTTVRTLSHIQISPLTVRTLHNAHAQLAQPQP